MLCCIRGSAAGMVSFLTFPADGRVVGAGSPGVTVPELRTFSERCWFGEWKEKQESLKRALAMRPP